MRIAFCVFLCLVTATLTTAAGPATHTRDSIRVEPGRDAEVSQRLEGLGFIAGAFAVSRGDAAHPRFDAELYFDSPKPSGDPTLDRVVLEWRYARRDGVAVDGPAPAVLVVHSVQSRLLVGRAVAMQAADRGVHAFVLHLPGYGHRLPEGERWSPVRAIERAAQGIADVRRARDAIAAEPGVDADRVKLVGISLGGYVAATAAAVEPGVWDEVWLVASGADVLNVLRHGEHDAARMARRLAAAGYRGEALRRLLDPVEPAPLLHRLLPDRTFLVRPERDRVVPPTSYDALIAGANLLDAHVLRWPANHYSMLLFLPQLVERVAPAAVE